MRKELITIILVLAAIGASLFLISYKFHEDTEFDKHEKLRRSEMEFYR